MMYHVILIHEDLYDCYGYSGYSDTYTAVYGVWPDAEKDAAIAELRMLKETYATCSEMEVELRTVQKRS